MQSICTLQRDMMILEFSQGGLIQVISENANKDSNLWKPISMSKNCFYLTTHAPQLIV